MAGYQTYFSYDLAPVSRFDDFQRGFQWLTGSTDPTKATPVDLTAYQSGTFQVFGDPSQPPAATGSVTLGTNGNLTITLPQTAIGSLAALLSYYYSVVLVALDGTHHTLLRGIFQVV